MIDTEPTADFQTTVPLRVTDFDRFGRIKPSSVLSLFQEAAVLHATADGIGHDAMEEHGVFWAVVRTYYEVERQPQLYTSVLVRTWPHTPSRFSFLRDYTICTLDGELLVKGISEWVFMNLTERCFVPLSDVYEPPENLLDERNFAKKPRKIKDFDTDEIEPFIIVPPFTSADINGHVNNTVYADYPFDALNPDEALDIESFQIDFRHEVRPSEPLEIYTTENEEGAIVTMGVNADGEVSFTTRFTRAN